MRPLLHYIGLMVIALICTLFITNWVFGDNRIEAKSFVRCGLKGKVYLEDQVHQNCKTIIKCDNQPNLCWEKEQ